MSKTRLLTKNKKAAFEMSMTTVIVIVLSMVMLILGVTLVQKIFQAGFNVVDITDQKTRDAINEKLGVGQEEELQFYLEGNTQEISQGETFGVAFRFSPEPITGVYSYETKVTEVDPNKCGTIKKEGAESTTIGLGKSGSLGTINSGAYQYGLIKITIPKEYPINCEIRYLVNIYKDGSETAYKSVNFDIRAVRKKVAGMF